MSLDSSLGNLLWQYSQMPTLQDKKSLEEKIWGDYGRTGAIFILDMSGFSRTTVTKGLVYYLSMVKRMQLLVEPLIMAKKGIVVKYDADNAFAFFESTHNAINAAIEINKQLEIENRKTRDELDIMVSIGIDYGEFLYLPEVNDYFGGPVNIACKLGEDIGKSGDILVAESAWNTLEDAIYKAKPGAYQISGIAFKAYKIEY